MPSFFCGIFGHKPTRGKLVYLNRLYNYYKSLLSKGIVSNYEMIPLAEQIISQNYLVTGPMSRFCADLLPMYRILAAENVSKLKLDSKVKTIQIV